MSEFSPITPAEISRFSYELEWHGDCLAETVENETNTAQILGGIVLLDYYSSVNMLRSQLGHDPGSQEYTAGPLDDHMQALEQSSDRRRFVDEFYEFMDELSSTADGSGAQDASGVTFIDESLGVVSVRMMKGEVHGLDGTVAARTRNIRLEVIGNDGTARMYAVHQQDEDEPLRMSAVQYGKLGLVKINDAKLTPGSQQYLGQVVAATRKYLRHQWHDAA